MEMKTISYPVKSSVQQMQPQASQWKNRSIVPLAISFAAAGAAAGGVFGGPFGILVGAVVGVAIVAFLCLANALKQKAALYKHSPDFLEKLKPLKESIVASVHALENGYPSAPPAGFPSRETLRAYSIEYLRELPNKLPESLIDSKKMVTPEHVLNHESLVNTVVAHDPEYRFQMATILISKNDLSEEELEKFVSLLNKSQNAEMNYDELKSLSIPKFSTLDQTHQEKIENFLADVSSYTIASQVDHVRSQPKATEDELKRLTK